MLQNIKLRRTGKDAETLLNAAGFKEATPLQEQYLSTALTGRDSIIESNEGEGKTIAQLLPFLSGSKPRKKGAPALILTDTVDSVEKYEREYRKFPATVTRGKSLIALGKAQQPKKELKLLTKQPAIIVGTTERIIDHLRRDNLSFSEEIPIVVNSPQSQGQDEFNRDVEFILTKIPQKKSISIFTPSVEQIESLMYTLKRPVTLHSAERSKQLPPFHLYEAENPNASLVADLIYAHDLYTVLLLVEDTEKAAEYRNSLIQNGISARFIDRQSKMPLQRQEEEEARFFRCSVVLYDDAQAVGFHYNSIIFFGLPKKESLFIETGKSVSTFSNPPTLSILIPSREKENFTHIQEKFQMNTKEEQLPEKEKVLEGQLKSMLQKIKEEENPDILNRYRKLVKKSVPFTMRGYLTAYLFKHLIEGGNISSQSGGSRGEAQNEGTAGTAEMQTIFVSIGKNRKVFPRDLARLFRSQIDLGPNDIGNIKVLDNYSFIDIPRDRAQNAIELMDNMEYRGRSITVNFARKKRGKRNNSEGQKTENNKGN